LEDAIYEEAGHEEECSKEHTVRALLKVDLEMTEKAAQQVGVGCCGCEPGRALGV